ncbi:fibronectin type III domain-containing protein [Flavobacterium sp.]|uniref:fibronectin type III domain-containing protein n=1 Tax=Flavobacterium sp. TaxID=239 RepID=UPI002C4A24F0|nr:fibronectin type III domain-containing protein [Flavobacterium sp.]HSD08144.1 fibronectin type III domain-containing protein [Flavobacterium sp.]
MKPRSLFLFLILLLLKANAFGSTIVSPMRGVTKFNLVKPLIIPSAPTNLIVTALTSTTINISWSGTADSFYIDVATTSAFDAGTYVTGYSNTDLGNVNATVITGLTPSTLYYFRIRAHDATGDSDYSLTQNALTSSITLPTSSAPVVSGYWGLSTCSVTVQWIGTADYFYIDIATTATFDAGTFVPGYENVNVGYVFSVLITDLNPNTNYYFRVRAFNSSTGISPNSETLPFKTFSLDPTIALAADNIQCNAAGLHWESTSYPTYYLDIATDVSFFNVLPNYNNRKIGGYGNVNAYVKNLPGGTLYYRVRVGDTCGNSSANSNTISFTTLGPDAGSISPVQQSICPGQTPLDLVLTGNTSSVNHWEKSTDIDFNTFVSIPITSTTLSSADIGILTQDTYFRAVTQPISPSICEGYSIQALITVKTGVTKTWNGVAWTPSGPPTLEDIIVFDGDANITVPIEACSCTINSGNVVVGVSGGTNADAVLKIESGLDVKSSGALIFENNSSLVQVSDIAVNSGNITYKRNTAALKKFDYVYWSSPVAGQQLGTMAPNTDLIYSWESSWNPVSGGIAMTNGKGYIIRATTDMTSQEGVFLGEPKNGIVKVATLGTGQYNLIGNPYPSAIDADLFIRANQALISGALYFWTHNTARALNGTGTQYVYFSDDYASYTLTGGTGTGSAAISGGRPPSGDIASGQAFFVASSGLGNFVFNNSMRIISSGKNSQFFKQSRTKKSATVEKNRIWLNLTNDGGAFKQLLVGYVTGATNDFDGLYDGVSMDGNKFIDFYSIGNSFNYTIQGRTLPFSTSDVVPLGYKTTIEGTFSIGIDKGDGVFVDQPVYLEDKQTNSLHDLKKGDYSFTTVKGEFKDRFVLRYSDAKLGTSDTESQTKVNEVIVSVKNGRIKVNSADEAISLIKVFDLKGSLVYEKDKVHKNEFIIDHLTSSDQILIVITQLENGKRVSEEIVFYD